MKYTGIYPESIQIVVGMVMLILIAIRKDLSDRSNGISPPDMSGHQQDPRQYWKVLERADRGISQVLEMMNAEDVLIVMADHGYDPFIGHSRLTREQVPLMLFKQGIEGRCLGLRSSLADVGASVTEFFAASFPQYGYLFMRKIN